jgi:thiamine-monophosphate kinase
MQTGLRSIGEFGLIERIKRGRRGGGREVLLGIGDDAAAFRLSPGQVGVATTDTLVEGRHFDLRYFGYGDLGWKAMAANLSDIAAMAGRPLLALAALTLTRRQTVRDVDRLYGGMRDLAGRYGVTVAGGDTVLGRELSVTLTVIGQCRRGRMGLRSGARPGDAVLVTGALGASRAGLEHLKSKVNPSTVLGTRPWNSNLIKKHLRPEPRIREGMALARRFRLGGMIDVSDGLASELWHLSRESRVGIVIDQGALPVAPEAVAVAGRLGGDPADYCLNGGEDYELLFTLAPGDAVRAKAMISAMGTRCSVIGQAGKGRGVRMAGRDGKLRGLRAGGYRHF